MKEIFRSNWTTVLLALIGWLVIILYGYSKFGLSRNVVIGFLGAIGLTLWQIRDRYITYVAIEDNRWLINSEEKLIPAPFKVDIASILYVARFPHFVFRSWGGRTMIFYRDENGEIKQTAFPETLYSWDNLKKILKRLVSIKPTIELDPQYTALLNARDNSIEEDLSHQLPRRASEIEAYIAEKYGPPRGGIGNYKLRFWVQIIIAIGLLIFAGAVLTL